MVAEQGFRHGPAPFLAGKPGFQNSRDMLLFPNGGDGAARLQHQHRGRACGGQVAHEFLLSAGQV